MNARFAEHREALSRLIVGSDCERLSEGSASAGMGSSVGSGSPAINAQNTALKEALAEKVDLLMVEEHRSASLRSLLNQSIIEVGRLKICLEEATIPTRRPPPGYAHPTATKSDSQSLNAQITKLKEALAEKTNLLKVEEHCSASLRDLLNQSIVEVGRLKICLGETVDAAGHPFPEASQYSQDAPHAQAGQERQGHKKPRQANNSTHGNQKGRSGAQLDKRIEGGEAEGESLTDEENGSALSRATTHVHNEEPFIMHISQGALLMGEEPRIEPTTAATEVGNEGPFLIPTDEDNFTLSPHGEDSPYMNEGHKDQ
ncbi:hypothetical protein HOY80DRAFT_642574 [Tuber brumale]|nr:hypothetical protein HOY80DRAFT_642574 [Tuber brumale]